MSIFYLEHPSQLEQVASKVKQRGWLFRGNPHIHIVGNLTIDRPMKFYGNSIITGDEGSSLTLVDKGYICSGEGTRSLTLKNLTVSSTVERGLFGIAPNTTKALKLNNVKLDVASLGSASSNVLVMNQVSFLNKEMKPLQCGQYLDTLMMTSIRHDGNDTVLDMSRTSLESLALVSDIYCLNPDSGLILLNDFKGPETIDRHNIAENSFILKNIQGLNRDIDIFRNRDTTKQLRTVSGHVLKQYVI